MTFPESSKLLPVLHRLITIATPLQWVPLPIAECQAALAPPRTQPAGTPKSIVDKAPDQRDAPHREAAGATASSGLHAARDLQQPLEEERGNDGPAPVAPTALSASVPAHSEALENVESAAVQHPGHGKSPAEGDSVAREHAQGQPATEQEQERCVNAHSSSDPVGEEAGLAEDHSQQQSYAACSTCVMQVLHTLGSLAVCNAEHMHEAVPLIMNSKCGFTAPGMDALQELLGPLEQGKGPSKNEPASIDVASTPSEPCEAEGAQAECQGDTGKVLAHVFRSADDSKLQGEESAIPEAEARQDAPQRLNSGAGPISIDVLKSAIERGGWALVPEKQAPAAGAPQGPPNVAAEAGPCSQGMYIYSSLFWRDICNFECSYCPVAGVWGGYGLVDPALGKPYISQKKS